MQIQLALSMFESGRHDNTHGDEDWLKAEQKENGVLTLARRAGQKIMINDDITILVQCVDLSKDPPQVKIGFDAPAKYVIDREEIYLKKKKERRENTGNR